MKPRVLCTFILLLFMPSLGLAAGSSSSTDSGRETYSAPAKQPELKAARLAIARKNYSLAISELNAVLSEKPEHADAWNLLGYSSRKSGDFKTAETAYKKALKIDPKHSEDLKRLLLTIPSISKIDVLNETESNVNINVYPKENRVILTEVAKIIADHKFPVKDIYQNHLALDEAFRKLTV